MNASPLRSFRVFALLVFVALGCGSAAPARRPAAALPAPLARAVADVSGQRLEVDVRALADDAMEGRGTGDAGYQRAADWVADRMRVLGLEPAGTTDYFDEVIELQ